MTKASLRLNAHSISESMSIVSTIHAAHSHASARHGCVNELGVVDVNTYVREFSAARIEKHQITRCEFFTADA